MDTLEHHLSIGDLARETGTKVPTIRYYEKIGLLPAPPRSRGNQRRYDPAALERLRFIRHARAFGFSIDDIAELLSLSDHPEQSCGQADAIARKHLEGVRNRIAGLRRLERELDRMTTACKGGTVQTCQVIKVLADHTLCKAPHP